MRTARQTGLLAVSMLPTIAMAQSFSFLSQERSVFARVGSTTNSFAAMDFGALDRQVDAIVTNAGASSRQRSTLGSTALSFYGNLSASSSATAVTNARGVFDVSFTLTQATDVRLFYAVNSYWNFTIWTPSGSQVIATSSQLGLIYDDRISRFDAGTYRLRADADVTNGQSGNITVEMTIVPAPSGIALAACAGLAACRRRRR